MDPHLKGEHVEISTSQQANIDFLLIILLKKVLAEVCEDHTVFSSSSVHYFLPFPYMIYKSFILKLNLIDPADLRMLPLSAACVLPGSDECADRR